MAWKRRGLGLLAWGGAALLGMIWISGADVWGEGPRHLNTPVGEIRADAGLPLRVAVIGDVQNGLSEFSELLNLTGELDPDLILQLGDTVNNAKPGRYAALHAVFREHGPDVPVLSVPGNHDVSRSDDSLELYETWMGPTHWRLDIAGWRILGLDNAAGPLSSESAALLAASGSQPPERGLVVLAHRPLSRTVEPRPDILFAGHVHSSDDFVDERGTHHYHHGNNCDRSKDNRPEDLPTVGILTLRQDGFDWDPHTVPRTVKLREEFRRLAGGSVYPLIREIPLAFILALALLVAGGAALLFRK